ncbi:MAG: hypothetical protein ACXAD7_25545 [Candidatus Kariarchaeaceae archaeon]|jgi:hypothetical protein
MNQKEFLEKWDEVTEKYVMTSYRCKKVLEDYVMNLDDLIESPPKSLDIGLAKSIMKDALQQYGKMVDNKAHRYMDELGKVIVNRTIIRETNHILNTLDVNKFDNDRSIKFIQKTRNEIIENAKKGIRDIDWDMINAI